MAPDAGGLAQRLRGRLRARLVRALGPRGMIDLGLRFGPYGSGWNWVGRGLSVRALERAPHGLDLGALRPALPARLRTRDRTVRLAPPELVADVSRLESWLERDAASSNGTLSLIGRRELRSNNSWMHNAERLMRGGDRCTLLMHPRDAAARGVHDTVQVRVRSRVGEVVVPVEVSDAMMPGVVSLPHGFGHGRDGVRLRIATRHAGASINDLTDDQRIDALLGTAAFGGVPVEVLPA